VCLQLLKFRGDCDLVLLSNPGFSNGWGLHIHIRTKQTHKDWVALNVKASKPENFVGTMCLMGSYPSGDLVARDGVTVMTSQQVKDMRFPILYEPATCR
jgi:hypothetical protein